MNRRAALTRVGVPPLQPGLPIVWCPTVVVFALAHQLRRCGVQPLPHGLLDELVAPWGCQRVRTTARFRVPCDCGRMALRLLLTPRGWACSACGGKRTRLEIAAGRLLFGFRLGLRGRYMTRLHAKVVRQLVGKLPRLRARRFAVVQAATVVVSYDPQGHERRHELGAVGQALAGELLDVWLSAWASPVPYAARCRAELLP